MSKGNRATVQALRRELVAMRGRIDTMLAESGTETTYAGMTCQGCEHEDMVHTNWVGACIIKGCNCPGMDKEQPPVVAAWHIVDEFMTKHYGPPEKPLPNDLQAEVDKVSKAMEIIARAINSCNTSKVDRAELKGTE